MEICKFRMISLLGIWCLLATACDTGPRIIEETSMEAETKKDDRFVFKNAAGVGMDKKTTTNSDQHEVKVEEILNTEKYSYLKASENGESFWIAISKREVEVGETYIYKGGLLKKNFFSREFDRVFETVYLVSNFRKKAEPKQVAIETHSSFQSESLPDLNVEKIKQVEGAITLVELFANKPKYSKATIKVTGKVVKVNPKIMNRNWLHLQDGSEEGLDLTITTDEVIPLGAVVSLEGVIALDKDFGAGYRYDIIMEGAVLK